MGDMADQLTEDMLEAKTLHDIGQCDMGCDWCREEPKVAVCNKCGWVGPRKRHGTKHPGCDYLA